MEESVLVSVVIPVYNREELIRTCIESVLQQTLKNLEVIVVDDCSTDKTVEVVNSIQDPRVLPCVCLEKNSGANYARNKGVSLATGTYIAFQDSDDVWLFDKLQKQLEYLEQGGFDFVFCGMERIDPFRGLKEYFPQYKFDERKEIQKQILYENCISSQCMFITKEMFETIKFDNEIRRFQDWDFAIRASRVAKIGYLNEALVISEIQENSISRNVSQYDSLLVIYNKYKEIIVENKRINARFLKKMGDDFFRKESKKAADLYKESLKNWFTGKVFLKYIFSKMGI